MQLLYAVNDVPVGDDALFPLEAAFLAEELLPVGVDVEGELLLQAVNNSEKPNSVRATVANFFASE
jgi:hypothetical protein